MKKYWSESYASWNALLSSIQDDIVYNNFWLQNSKYIISAINEDNNIDFDSFEFPLTNWRWFLWYFQRWKKISFDLLIKWSTNEELNNNIDELRKAIFQPNKNLDIKTNWVVRRIKATCLSNPKSINHYNITFLKTKLDFETLEPFFYKLNYQTNSFLDKTENFTEEITNQWTSEALPIFFITFKNSIVWTNSIEVEIWENSIIINQTINTWDTLIINWETKEVKYNWTIIDYDWVFPYLWVNWNSINFIINWTFTIDIILLNKIYYV